MPERRWSGFQRIQQETGLHLIFECETRIVIVAANGDDLVQEGFNPVIYEAIVACNRLRVCTKISRDVRAEPVLEWISDVKGQKI